MTAEFLPKWQERLRKEMSYSSDFRGLTESEWKTVLKSTSVTSDNHDTLLSLDWPHNCSDATEACGGINGWCYTFQGRQASAAHNRHAAMVDLLARRFPALFCEAVAREVGAAVHNRKLAYPNLRYGGSGEAHSDYLDALDRLASEGIHLWGFTRSIRLALALRAIGAAAIVSCDKTSRPELVSKAKQACLPLAYTSDGVRDRPPPGTLVTFPLHRVGRVREVVESETLCPKVVSEFFLETRPRGYCQAACSRCHGRSGP